MSPVAAPPTTPRATRWDRWQATPISQRLLSLQARQEGYSVLRVPRALREAFCELARIFTTYDRLFQKQQRALTPAQLQAFLAWHEATQQLLVVLQEKEQR